MSTHISAIQRLVLRAVCDTFFPSLAAVKHRRQFPANIHGITDSRVKALVA